MRFKLTIVLLLANLVVFFALWRLDRPAPLTLKPSGLVDFSPDHITVKDNTLNEVRELVLDPGGHWRLVQPVQWNANENAVYSLINYLLRPAEQSFFSADDMAQHGDTLSEYGLDKPRVELTIAGRGKSVKLDIGSGTPAGNNLYVMNPADHLVRVWTQDFLASVERPLSDLRDPQIFTIPVFEVQQLSIWASPSGPGAAAASVASAPKLVRFSMAGNDNSKWQLDTPVQRPADPQQVNSVLMQLNNLNAVSFLPEAEFNLVRQGLATPSLSVELKGENGSEKLLLGAPVANATTLQYYAKKDDSNQVFIVNGGEPFDTLRNAQDKLREHQFFDFAPEKVSTITLRFYDAELRIQKAEHPDDPWKIQMKDPSTGELSSIVADPDIVRSLLDDLRNLTAKSFTTEAPDDLQLKTYGLAKPTWKISLQTDKTTLNLDIGQTTDSPYHYYAKLENADSVYEIDGDILGDFSIDPLHFRNRILESLSPATKISSLRLTRLKDDLTDDGAPLINITADATKTPDEQLKDKTQAERTNILALSNWLRNAAVDSYLKASFDEHTPYPLQLGNSVSTPVPWRYRLDAGLETPAAGQTPAQSKTLTLYFTEQYGSQQLGGTHTPEAIFKLPFSIISLLGTFTKDTSLPPAVVQTLQQMDQPIDARTAPAPAATTTAPVPAPAPAAATSAATTP